METAGAGTPATHPAVAPLAFLLGKWRGEGEGSFPTISSFRYGEELLFSHHPSKVRPSSPPALFLSREIFPFGCPNLRCFSLNCRDWWWVGAAGDLIHAEDVEGGVRRSDARRERVLATPPRRLRRGGHRAEHRPRRGPGELLVPISSTIILSSSSCIVHFWGCNLIYCFVLQSAYM